MPDTHYLAAYWGVRPEPPQVCARRAQRYFRLLAESAPADLRWLRIGLDEGELPEREIAVDAEVLQELFMAGRHRRECDGQVLERLGMHLRLTGRNGELDMLRVEIVSGAHTASTMNFCRVDLLGPAGGAWLTPGLARRWMKASAQVWEPDWAALISHEHRDGLPPEQLGRPLVGWMLYLSSERGAIPPLAAPSRAEAVGGLGNLIVTVPERFSSEEATHLSAARAVYERLNEEGILRPRPR